MDYSIRPVLASGDIESILSELAEAIEESGPHDVVVSADDAAAIRWVLDELAARRFHDPVFDDAPTH